MAEFAYQAEKLSVARRALMLPNPKGEARSLANAFIECYHAFRELDLDAIDEEAPREWIATIKRLMDTSGVEDTTGEGTYFHRAEAMSIEEQAQFSDAVNELASWFAREFDTSV